jgi:ATP-binding cassette subfamily F protein uup
MDRLVDHLLVFEGEGEIRDFPGNYSQYREWEKNQEEEKTEKPTISTPPKETAAEKTVPEKKRFSYKEKREFELLEKEIPRLEQSKTAIENELAQSGIPFERLQQLTQQLVEINTSLEQMEMRWLELSEYTD